MPAAAPQLQPDQSRPFAFARGARRPNSFVLCSVPSAPAARRPASSFFIVRGGAPPHSQWGKLSLVGRPPGRPDLNEVLSSVAVPFEGRGAQYTFHFACTGCILVPSTLFVSLISASKNTNGRKWGHSRRLRAIIRVDIPHYCIIALIFIQVSTFLIVLRNRTTMITCPLFRGGEASCSRLSDFLRSGALDLWRIDEFRCCVRS